MEGFNKIDLETVPSQPAEPRIIDNRPKPKAKINFLKKSLIALGVILAVLFISGLILIAPLQKVYSDAKSTFKQVKIAVDALKKQNITLTSEELNKTKESLTQTQKSLDEISYFKFIPLASAYYNDAQHLIKAGFYGLSAARVLVDSITPYADILGLKGQGSFVGGTASQRIQTAVTTMGKIAPHIDDIAVQMEGAKKEIDAVDPNHYPAFFGGEKIRNGLFQSKQLIDQGVGFVSDARPLIKILPSLLGDPKEKKYLILFQNDKELRPTGGFITGYAIFRIVSGVIHVDSANDIYSLDAGIYGKQTAPAPILKYLANVPVLNLRDSNLSPDFITSMETFNSLYKKAAGYVPVDGIIALDTNVLVSTIKILDDEVYADGIRFTSKTDPRCDCPQVIYELESLISTPKSVDLKVTTLRAVQSQRKDIIGTLLYAIMDKALKSSPKLYWGPLFQDMLVQTQQKHVLFDIYNQDAQSGIEALNAAGRIRTFEGDYLHINQANFGGAKSNMFVQETVTQNYEMAEDKTITKKLTINYKNPHKPSDCNLERGNLCINAVLRDWIRIYVPLGSKLVDSKGSEVKMISYDELGKTVFEGFLTVRPLGSAVFSISYTLPFKVKDGSLPLLIQKQPGTGGNEYTLKVNDNKIDKFELLTDRETKIKL
ncbi:MAG: hypothetical protein A3B47_00175 [Candidatus Levybacteria bacterium RIFCSPLOWO2_01_FULL_39_24]|nr:MAG: hypothetical protein A2800_01015 [Candidatus Levybacteria bacterium RIFCSPHIGHO2_01_FULL_40_16]OGH28322.1 MAG: hypothetical protein A3E12_01305 [Candidatus Levybacteria bacterium RIFCSPHIGHO2_12_FULL_39_9]OGH46192.1 MAG: hypothetical protein A3B47_00175 [Candidatus Levybacteria bacterium RIFCSPLOWO2_01_FULL_39_24]